MYMDELHVHHTVDVSWLELDGHHGTTNLAGDGQRIIVVHAITKEAPVISDDWRQGGKEDGFPKSEGWFVLGPTLCIF